MGKQDDLVDVDNVVDHDDDADLEGADRGDDLVVDDDPAGDAPDDKDDAGADESVEQRRLDARLGGATFHDPLSPRGRARI